MTDLITQGRVVELIDLLSQLPKASRWWGALMDDADYAEMVAEASLYRDDDGDDPPSFAPAFRDYTPLYQLTAQVHDAIGVLNYTTGAVQGAKMKKPKPWPIPETAIDKAQSAAQLDHANDFLAKLGRGPLNAGAKVAPQPRQSVSQHQDD